MYAARKQSFAGVLYLEQYYYSGMPAESWNKPKLQRRTGRKRNGARMYWRSSFAFPRLRSKFHSVYEAVQLDATDIYRQILLTSAERILHFTSYLSLWSRCSSAVNSGSSSHHVVVRGGGDDVLLPLIAPPTRTGPYKCKKVQFPAD